MVTTYLQFHIKNPSDSYFPKRQMMKPSLKRSNAVWDLTKVPLDTPLQVDLNIHCQTTASNLSKDVQLKLDAFTTVRKLKLELEPFCYSLYKNQIDQMNESQRNHYTRMASPRSPSSDYHSEEDSEGDEHDLNVFLNSMKIYYGDVLLEDCQQLCDYHMKEKNDLICLIDLNALLF